MDIVPQPADDTYPQVLIASVSMPVIALAYSFASLATMIKTIAWWFNQWPFTALWSFFLKWVASAAIAGLEYLPLTLSFTLASTNGIQLSLMTAYMEVADNAFRMFQQLALGDTLYWYDWLTAALLAICVMFQAILHVRPRSHRRVQVDENPEESTITQLQCHVLARIFVILSFVVVLICVALLVGPSGQAYALATLATAAKTFAWWINQYPVLHNKALWQKWLVGWGIAAVVEYLPLIGAFTIASANKVHLGLMTAYMEALDNLFRMCQQVALGKPLHWYDWACAGGMLCAVLFQGVMHFSASGGVSNR